MARSEKIKLVQNDTKPVIRVTLTDSETEAPIDVSNAGDVIKLYFRKLGDTTLKATITGTKPGGGTDGVVDFAWAAGDLDTVGDYEGEIEITYADTTVQTMYEKLKFSVREEVGP